MTARRLDVGTRGAGNVSTRPVDGSPLGQPPRSLSAIPLHAGGLTAPAASPRGVSVPKKRRRPAP